MLIAKVVLGVPVPLSNSANDVILHQCSDDTRASLILQQLLQIPTTLQPQAGANPFHPARLPEPYLRPSRGLIWLSQVQKGTWALQGHIQPAAGSPKPQFRVSWPAHQPLVAGDG